MLDVELPGDDADAMTAEYDVFAQGAQGAEGDELLERARLALDGGIVWIFDIFALAIEHFDDEPVTQARRDATFDDLSEPKPDYSERVCLFGGLQSCL